MAPLIFGTLVTNDPVYYMQKLFMKSFSDTSRLTHEHQTYSYWLSSCGNGYREVKGQWRCLLKRNDYKLELSKKMALICCGRHNICEEHGDSFVEEFPDKHITIHPPVQALPEHIDPDGVLCWEKFVCSYFDLHLHVLLPYASSQVVRLDEQISMNSKVKQSSMALDLLTSLALQDTLGSDLWLLARVPNSTWTLPRRYFWFRECPVTVENFIDIYKDKRGTPTIPSEEGKKEEIQMNNVSAAYQDKDVPHSDEPISNDQ
ncbi:uncharacterized protein V6R79_018734 [Siganus canaliculatus]